MNAYKIDTWLNTQQSLVIADSIGEAEKIYLKKYPTVTIKYIELISECVLVKEKEE